MTTLVRLVKKWRLDLLMRDREITDQVVAKRLGVTPRTVARWREAQVLPSTINVDRFDALLKLLNCSRNELWDNEDVHE
jgi:DNA-binding Xre family transcriptional regulator